MVEELLRNGSINSRDLVNIGYRKNQLEVFSALLYEILSGSLAIVASMGLPPLNQKRLGSIFSK